MKVRLSLKPGQKGTKGFVEKYGKQLFRVRYRYDGSTRKRYTTVELIVAEAPWDPLQESIPGNAIVGIRINPSEKDKKVQVKTAGASGTE